MITSCSSSPSEGLSISRTLVLVGMMGSGKSSVGRRLAARFSLPFADADNEVEKAAGLTISQLINDYGEPEFRQLERRVMARLLDAPPHVLATGGGAFIDSDTRSLIREKGLSVWLKADHEILLERTLRHQHRPLLQGGDPRQIMQDLLAKRQPVYAEADIVVESADHPVDHTVEQVVQGLKQYFNARAQN